MKPKFYTLENSSGMKLRCSSLGGIATSLLVPDRDGKLGDVLLAMPEVQSHHANGYMNALIGRVGNRISGGGFWLNGTRYDLPADPKDKPVLHGGPVGFDQKIWDVRSFEGAEGPSLEFTTLSPDGDQGFPGNLFVRVVYTLTQQNAWRIDYWAITDRPTVVNLTQHAYFNLCGDGKSCVCDHLVQVDASRFTEVGASLIPTGRELPVEGTALDLREPVRIGDCLKRRDKHLRLAGGLDHNFVLDRMDAKGLAPAGALYHEASGRLMEIWTTEPCMQVYSANFLAAGTVGKGGAVYGPHSGICFETQHAPDSPNQAGFPSITLLPGEVYHSATLYLFSTVN